MIRFAATAISVIILMASLAFAQDATVKNPQPAHDVIETPKVQVFGGYSFFHVDHAGLTGELIDDDLLQASNPFAVTNHLNGWSAEGQYNAGRWIGFAADIGGRYGSPIMASRGRTLIGLPKGTTYSFLAGPVISYRTKSRLTPYVHLLFGWDRTSLSASTITGSVTSPVSVAATTNNYFVMAPGVGADFKVARRWSVRLGQLDWYHTSLNQDNFYTHALGGTLFEGLGNHEDNLRFSTGAVVRF